MKSHVGLGQIYEDLGQAPDASPPEHAAKPPGETAAAAPPVPAELVSVTVHVEKKALEELLRKAPQS